jgi:hypothetical protein
VLDEPFDLPTNSPLIVTVLSREDQLLSRERAQWAALAAQSLARAYGDDEPEYTDAAMEGRSAGQRGLEVCGQSTFSGLVGRVNQSVSIVRTDTCYQITLSDRALSDGGVGYLLELLERIWLMRATAPINAQTAR